MKVLLLGSLLWAPLGGALHEKSAFDKDTWDRIQAKVAWVVAQPASPVRNMQITEAYREIGLLFQALTHSPNDANWPTISAWASSTVGVGIRKQLLPHWLDEILRGWPAWLRSLLKSRAKLVDYLFDGILAICADYLSEGNRLVFDEIGSAYTAFGSFFANISQQGPDAKRLAAYLGTFGPHQAPLAEAMQMYYQAMWRNVSAHNRTQIIFYANALVGLWEQTRLQPFIAAAFLRNYTVRILGFNVSVPIAGTMTSVLMSLVFPPDDILWMGDDLPERKDGREWPVGLSQLDWPGLNHTYLRYAPSANGRQGTAARDWTSLSQRMRYVWPMFRQRQDLAADWTCPVFSRQQVAQIWKNITPPESALCIPYNPSCCHD